jgi:hypothetical protein
VARKQSTGWRTLDNIEIALIKRMKRAKLPRDQIMSFFIRPGRVISPAVVAELEKTRPDIAEATDEDVTAFINRRMSEANTITPHHGFGPTSELRVREILQLTADGQKTLPGFESYFAEFKRELPKDRSSKGKAARTLAAFANNEGGYLFFGIDDSGAITGISESEDIEKFWDELADLTTRHFTPFFQWDRGRIAIGDTTIAVAYSYKAPEKPIIASSEYTPEIRPGQIFFRYNRSSETIRATDLVRMLSERDRLVLERAAAIAAAE